MRISDFDNVFLATSDPSCKEGFLRGYNAAFLAKVMAELRNLLGEANDRYLYVIDSPSFQKLHLAHSLAGKIPILFYVGDENNSFDDLQPTEFPVVFRQYMQGLSAPRVYPMPLGTTPLMNSSMVKTTHEKRINIFFSGCLNANRIGLYTYFRFGKEIQSESFLLSRVLSRILRQFGKKDLSWSFADSYIQFTDGFQRGLPQSSYAEKICDSRIVICPYGFISPETIRHYEALQSGCTVITKRWPFNDFLAKAPMVVVDSWQELETIIPGLLSNPDVLAENQRKALEWWESFGSPEGFASYVAERILRIAFH
jgi:hypothetical protein